MLISFADSREAEIRKEIASGNFSTVQSFVKDELNKSPNKRDQNLVAFAIDTAGQNPIWRARFAKAFAQEMGIVAPKFEVFSEEDKSQMQNYTITGGVSGTNVDGILETTILPVIDGLVWDTNPILSRVSQIPVGLNDGNQSFELNEFNSEQAAEDLEEDDAGTEADDTVREGDTLTPKNKIQASTAFTEYALLTLSDVLLAQYVARLIKRVQNRYVYNIFKGSNASNQFKGIINSFGSTVDNQEGALAFSDSSNATDNVDLLLRSLGDLPDAVTQAEESKFAFYMTRQAFYGKVLPVQDTTTNYKLAGVINDLPGQRSIAGLPVIFTGYAGLGDTVVLADLGNYYIARKGGLRMITDTAAIKTGVVTMVAREYADGGMALAHKNVAGGSAGTSDNQARNMFRSIELGTL